MRLPLVTPDTAARTRMPLRDTDHEAVVLPAGDNGKRRVSTSRDEWSQHRSTRSRTHGDLFGGGGCDGVTVADTVGTAAAAHAQSSSVGLAHFSNRSAGTDVVSGSRHTQLHDSERLLAIPHRPGRLTLRSTLGAGFVDIAGTHTGAIMVVFQNGDDAIAAVDGFCAFALEMLEDPAAIERIKTLKQANRSYDQRRFPIANPNHYHKTLHDQVAKVLGPQRYNLMSEGYYRIYLAQRSREEHLWTTPTRRDMNEREDMASIRYQYRQATERAESRTREASH